MKISIFKQWYSLWIDYSKREDCLWVFEITEEEKTKIEKGASYEIVNWELKITETEEYLEKIKEEEKQKDIEQAYKKFNDTLEPITSKYTQEEINWFLAEEQNAIKVLNWETSEFINSYTLDNETPEELALKIINNANYYYEIYWKAKKQLREDLKIIKEKYDT